ncbi:MAG: hypothetical protein CENE_00349 [Candidatus Celerinatantimonas neptuna]|nr:MAG: hypothetical protein CENE_00349 [Candidatus Celerinatantimonas neptuna]
MENTLTGRVESPITRLSALLKVLGPGILMATAAIGGSHLVASTQAGAKFGWQLVILILAVNLFKYPFFRSGITYTMATGNSLLQGYFSMGKAYLMTSFVLNIFAATVNTAALVMFSASLLGYFLPLKLSIASLSLIVIAISLLIVLAGHFSLLNKVSKFIMVVLSATTVTAAAIAWHNGVVAPAGFVSPSPWHLASIGFLVATMGWMPAPIEVSCLTSLWLVRQRQEQNQVTMKSALFDFNLGYLLTALLALVFLSLGALVLHGSSMSLVTGGIGFTHQLVNIYAVTIGEWSRYLIALIAFFCIFGSTITVLDGYSRALNDSAQLLFSGKTADGNRGEKLFVRWVLFVAIACFCILLFFKTALLTMLAFAMTLAFMSTPMFAWLNHRLIRCDKMPEHFRPGWFGNLLSYAGLVYLFGFLIVFIWWKWFM